MHSKSIKRTVVFLLLTLLCVSAYSTSTFTVSTGAEFAFGTYNGEKSTRITFPIVHARGFYDAPNNADSNIHFTVIYSAGLGISLVESAVPENISNHIHPDIFFSFLPGVTFNLDNLTHITISAGMKYSRLGYRFISGDKEGDGWDKALSLILLGSKPLRIIAVAADLNIRFGEIENISLSLGLNASLPVSQSGNEHFRQKFSLEPYVSIIF